jgi:hypothetical protein
MTRLCIDATRKTTRGAATLEAVVEAMAISTSGDDGGTSQDFTRETHIKFI